jgi:uncharacterized protein (DUF1499 family)
MWWQTALIVAGASVVVWAAIMVAFSLSARRPADLGATGGRLRPCPATPNCVCTFDADDQHRIEPLTFADGPAEAWRRLQEVLARHPRTVVVTVTEEYLHAECTSLVFRFVDDVEFLLDAAGKKIHFRSASRVGRSDLGVNRSRMEAIRTAFEGK